MSAAGLVAEAAKLPAFVRRDWKIALSYRAVFVGEAMSLAMQIVVFFFIAKLVDPGKLPQYGGTVPTYLAFVVVGLVVNLTAGALLHKVSARAAAGADDRHVRDAARDADERGDAPARSVSYTLLMVPVRAAILLVAIAIGFGLDFQASGIGPALLLLMAFLPFTWGLGLVSAAAVVTFRRGAERDGDGRDHARAAVRGRVPDRAAAALPADDRGVESVRDRDRRRPRGADRRDGLGRPSSDLPRLVPLVAARPGARCALLPRRGRARAPPRHVGALLMESMLWERVGELADRAPQISDLRHHKLQLIAASRMRRAANRSDRTLARRRSGHAAAISWHGADAAAPHPGGRATARSSS